MNTKVLLAAAILVMTACSFSPEKPEPSAPQKRMSNSLAVIELFTSEGCSSCPSADALMPQLKERYGDNLIVLAFHVDYWDRLGWKDPFSSSENTRRQNQYSNAFNADNIYTPQAIVNGSTGIVGSDESGLEKLIAKSSGVSNTISVSAKADGKNVAVSYDAGPGTNGDINLALVQTHASVNVRRGENGGRQLEHYNVVRAFKTVTESKGNLSFTLPDGMASSEFHVVAFGQQSNMHITSAKEVSVE